MGSIITLSEKQPAVCENLPGVFDIYTGTRCKISKYAKYLQIFNAKKAKYILATLGQILQQALKDANISYKDAANYMGISEENLYRIFKKYTFEVAYLKKAAALLNLPISHFLEDAPLTMSSTVSQLGDSNHAGSGNYQKVTGDNSPSISGNNSKIDLTIDTCKQALKESEREVEYLKGQLARADALVESKDMTISLLRSHIDR